ncbi:MAG: tetratricopeptide repeat protein, partial [Bryobacteraceae bacterium]
CTTCHDPHADKVRKDACKQCHTAAHAGDETIAAASCESCHMPRRVPSDAIHTTMTDHKIVRRAEFRDPDQEDHTPYTGRVVPYYRDADELSLALVNAREATPETVALYRRLLEREPGNVPVLVALGKALLRLGRPREAIPVFDDALRANKMQTEARSHLAVAQALLGRHQEALTQLRRAVSDNPDDALSWTNLGVTLEVLGDRDGALDAYSEAIRLQPDSSEARHRRARLAEK